MRRVSAPVSDDDASPTGPQRAGWHRHPGHPTVERYWDGSRWTGEHRFGATGAAPAAAVEPGLADRRVELPPQITAQRQSAASEGSHAQAGTDHVASGVVVFGWLGRDGAIAVRPAGFATQTGASDPAAALLWFGAAGASAFISLYIWLALVRAVGAACEASALLLIIPLTGLAAATVFCVRGVRAAGGIWWAYAIAAVELLFIGNMALFIAFSFGLVCMFSLIFSGF